MNPLVIFTGPYATLAKWGVIAILILGLGIYGKVQSGRLDACKADFGAFQAKVEVLGQEAEKAAKKAESDNLRAKKRADDEIIRTKRDLADLYVSYRSLRDQRNAGSGLVPAAAPSADRPDRICYDRSKLAGAMGILEVEIPRILEQGDVARLKLATATEWAASLSAAKP